MPYFRKRLQTVRRLKVPFEVMRAGTGYTMCLLAIMLLSSVTVVLGLSAFQVRLRLQDNMVDNQKITLRQLSQLAKLDALKERESEPQGETDLRRLLTERHKLARTELKLRQEIFQREQELLDAIKLSPQDGDFALPADFRARAALLTLKLPPTAREKLQPVIEALKKRNDEYELLLLDDKQSRESLDEAVQKRAAVVAAENDRLKTALRPLFGSQFTDTTVWRIRDLLQELQSVEILGILVWVPQELLTLFVVMGAGILGRAAFLLRTARTEKEAPWVSGIVDPLFGAMLALVLFIVLKAGVLIAVDPRSIGQNGAELNPFFLAFVGLIGGLLSEQILDKVRELGASLLSEKAQGLKWAKERLRAEMAEKGLQAKTLADLLEQPVDVVNAWIAGVLGIPRLYQAAVAVWVGIRSEEIFEDRSVQGEP